DGGEEVGAVKRVAERPQEVQHGRVVRVAAVGVIAAEAPAGRALRPLPERVEVAAVARADEAGDTDERGDQEQPHQLLREAPRCRPIGAAGRGHGAAGCSMRSGLSSASRRYGTLTTTVCGRPSSAARSRLADWLYRIRSHQLRATYSGITTNVTGASFS